MTGLIGFACASVPGGAATGFDVLVTARVAQGLFAALLAPAALSLLGVTFTGPAEKPKAFDVFSAPAGAGGAIGLPLGGMLTEWASWRWVMYVNVVFAAVAPAGAVLLPAARPAVTERPRLDVPGTLVASAALPPPARVRPGRPPSRWGGNPVPVPSRPWAASGTAPPPLVNRSVFNWAESG